MTPRQRVHAALEGKPADRMPVAALYCQLYQLDHFAELTGRPQWQMHQWTHATPHEHLATLRKMIEAAPLEIIQPQGAPPREVRERAEFFAKDGRVFRRFGEQVTEVPPPVAGHADDYVANETQRVFDTKDVDEQVTPTAAQDELAAGCNDYIDAAVAALGEDHFIISGGVAGTIWVAGEYVGQTNLLAMLVDRPGFVDYLCEKILERHIEHIRCLAAAGGDAIYLDDATATGDMISPAHYERFSLPYMREMVREVHALGHKAILIYFGDVMDRLEQIASIGADGLCVETSMKGYVNDIATIADTIGDRVALFANIDPVWVLEKANDDELAAEIRRQVAAAQSARGFIISPASPITPGTPLSRVRRFIELGQELGREK